MFIKQFIVSGLGHASYLIGSKEAGVAAVIDPRRDVQPYLALAEAENMRIVAVCETHLHNDYVSGGLELRAKTGATVHVAASANASLPHTPVRDSDIIRLGEVGLLVLETPGHTPEHLSYVAVDMAEDSAPWLILSGGALLVGAVGRPDLLGGGSTAEELAHKLYYSLHDKILRLPDYVEVYPTHVSGSLCGSGIAGNRYQTTIGIERATNPYLHEPSEEAFVRLVVERARQVGIPTYYRRMGPTNRAGAALIGSVADVTDNLKMLTASDVSRATEEHVYVLDIRPAAAYLAAHIPGSYAVPLSDSFPTWVGWTVPFDRPLILVADDDPATAQQQITDAVTHLVRIGYNAMSFAGYLPGMIGWQHEGFATAHTVSLSAADAALLLNTPQPPRVLDVRNSDEIATGTIPDALHITLGDLAAAPTPDMLDPDAQYLVVCAAGFRATIAASLLEQRNFSRIVHLAGGMDAWQAAALPVSAMQTV